MENILLNDNADEIPKNCAKKTSKKRLVFCWFFHFTGRKEIFLQSSRFAAMHIPFFNGKY
ncbi:hypothetical protein BCV53_10955 [Parageobacillus thermoglucosidasius]|uniref:Uncharacterized protein n=1 Tax=Parageobacillus thermoglucosidasius TaxID=1426 RepID=A0AAN0YQD2_PARTM|nr:hypothetical protein AOT13_10940 [Parageobacillus thermoglucosidasius]ANZ30566.1 hypothetical protein BCV53_10955 [Parageobacillus thermoglucosidasius]APM81304.1 hypothetical protein BCV54_10965 [Parageobacillus thermoglucosidasius]KJX68132.1 hypothetical protein WH82_14040 [Parageobacillus thermoglucosidasius]RDE21893.1 hypothetical protein DV712_17655 [Parageobacillus thermoglucosidasius]